VFQDSRAEKIKSILGPLGIWIAAGMLGELLGVLLEALCLRETVGAVVTDFSGLLETVHEEGETALLLFRDVLAAAVIIWLFRRDGARIEAEGKSVISERQKIPAEVILLSAIAALAYCVFMNLLLAAVGLLSGSLSGSFSEETAVSEKVLTVLFSVVVAPVTEELLLRGLVYRRVRTYASPLAGVLISSALFAVLHWDPAQSIFAFFLGTLLCDVYEWTGRLWIPVCMHGCCNIAALAARAPVTGKFLSEHAVPITILSGLLLAGTILLLARATGRRTHTRDDGRQETG